MTRMAKNCFITLAILFLWHVEEVVEACKCIPIHPQQAFCNSDVVLRVRVTRRQEIDHDTLQSIKYDIKVMKVFKGPQDVDAVYTSLSSASCGVTLTIGQQYLITGRVADDGKVLISSCDFIEQWDTLSTNQKLSLAHHYGNGCSCKITYCSSVPCVSSSPTECLWDVNDERAKTYACIKRNNGSCFWYKGSAPQ